MAYSIKDLEDKIGENAVRALMMDNAFVCPYHLTMPITGNQGRCNKIHYMGKDSTGETVADDYTFYVPAELKDSWQSH